jgi:hypothetical protein
MNLKRYMIKKKKKKKKRSFLYLCELLCEELGNRYLRDFQRMPRLYSDWTRGFSCAGSASICIHYSILLVTQAGIFHICIATFAFLGIKRKQVMY